MACGLREEAVAVFGIRLRSPAVNEHSAIADMVDSLFVSCDYPVISENQVMRVQLRGPPTEQRRDGD